MDKIKKFTKHCGCDIGNIKTSLEPLNGVGMVGAEGINKHFTLQQLITLAYEIKANIIVKSGKIRNGI